MAAVDYFLKIDGIKGESQDSKHKDELQITSYSWAATQSGTFATGSGGGAGKVSVQDFHFAMPVNSASPKLMLACATGEHIKTAVLTCRKAGKEQQEYMTIKFSDVIVSGYHTGGGDGGIVPVDKISLDFAKIEFEYKTQKPDGTLAGSVKSGYDLQANKAL